MKLTNKEAYCITEKVLLYTCIEKYMKVQEGFIYTVEYIIKYAQLISVVFTIEKMRNWKDV